MTPFKNHHLHCLFKTCFMRIVFERRAEVNNMFVNNLVVNKILNSTYNLDKTRFEIT